MKGEERITKSELRINENYQGKSGYSEPRDPFQCEADRRIQDAVFTKYPGGICCRPAKVRREQGTGPDRQTATFTTGY